MPSATFHTLGCRLNQAESDAMAEQLASRGVGVATSDAEADVIVVNTCTVTKEATKASRQTIRRAVKNNPEAKVVVIGCYAVSNPDEIAGIEGVDLVVGNDEKDRILETLDAAPALRPLLQIGTRRLAPAREAPVARVRANLKVQTGCDEWCTFCIIPTTRGPLRSYDEEGLVAEARARIASGAREIVLTGVHLGKYAYDQGGDERRLVDLLQRLLSIEGLWRLRLSSILSNHLTEELIDFVASDPRVCRYLHVPLQSGDDGVLEAMHRPYRVDEFVERVEATARRIPGLALATDIIVGFPGESDEAFEATVRVVERIGFSKLHVFRYSARPDTPAASMAGEIPPDVKRWRSKRLIDVGNEIRGRFLNAHLNVPLEVLVEDERYVDGVAVASGQTSDYVRVWFEAEGLLGSLARVRGERVRADGIAARLLETKEAV
ncbi:MAG TPA: tRNA (N(6)-L-threonylcarbamoyladenosine(37)-C(2))-methylthiotransferase MtaB [Actinomycetota bacterium]|jgi:threonylcarbamoyladenosine tRNA methylthiotransferase MtaB|nr:tRNA (N(6)-L-threonylcarbamoyladenosine(37)-C(2))-methylthiotransferase MtaB [Actinomycetota bacterium]